MPLLFTCAVGFLRWREDAKFAFIALTFLMLLTAYHLNAWCESWFRNRTAKVFVGGADSAAYELANIVFQGTV